MRTPIFQVDAFTTRQFGGNPAVMLLAEFRSDELMQVIAAENKTLQPRLMLLNKERWGQHLITA
jgi:predicted PhzF superfamily epimerase YddE/YHI9